MQGVKFEETLKNDPQRARFALEQIQLLYRLERKAKDEHTLLYHPYCRH